MSRLAWVSGSKPNGYELVVTLVNSTSRFHTLNHKRFYSYRAAQTIANAINAACKVKS